MTFLGWEGGAAREMFRIDTSPPPAGPNQSEVCRMNCATKTCVEAASLGPCGAFNLSPSQGYLATLASFGPFSALYFMLYEQAKAASQTLIGEENRRHDGRRGLCIRSRCTAAV